MSRKKSFYAYIFLSLGAVLIIFPFIWMVLSSMKTPEEMLKIPPTFLPEEFSMENFKEVLSYGNLPRYFFNSVFVTTWITIGELITCILASFAFAKLEFKGKGILFAVLMGTMMVPGEVLVIPNFVILSKLGWIDTYKALIFPWCTSVFAIFFLRQHFIGIPKELYYCSKVDGCSDFKFLTNIAVPMAKPAIITVAILKIINSWNSFMWPMVMTNSDEMRTLPTALSKFTTEVGADYHLLMALSAMIILPMIVVFLLLKKYVFDGVKGSGIKG
ncbi:MAG: carbohydrate ABC transporter permease [Clostridium sp.]|uniref:carbohydrate ABC transporter permease n=1 Tax=Clostridium sp. TaxID=1506 RepID=UPI002A8703D9|nr:carbohydrate ABC transporter permease [Clostridium sp.]MDY5097915.1 carbohydrate ABC transporter permease [Clostridium sp.]